MHLKFFLFARWCFPAVLKTNNMRVSIIFYSLIDFGLLSARIVVGSSPLRMLSHQRVHAGTLAVLHVAFSLLLQFLTSLLYLSSAIALGSGREFGSFCIDIYLCVLVCQFGDKITWFLPLQLPVCASQLNRWFFNGYSHTDSLWMVFTVFCWTFYVFFNWILYGVCLKWLS